MPNISVSPIDLTASYGVKPHQEQSESHQSGRDVKPDSDADNHTTPSTKPTVNTSGHTVGTIINTKA